jgi:protein Mpv17
MASQPAAHPAQPVATSSQRVPPAAPSPGPSGTPSAPTLRPSLPRRLITAYLQQLSRRPLRTKMITSSFLFFLGDSMAQFGIEGRRLPWSSAPDVVEEDPTLPPSSVDRVPTKLDDSNAVWDVSVLLHL